MSSVAAIVLERTSLAVVAIVGRTKLDFLPRPVQGLSRGHSCLWWQPEGYGSSLWERSCLPEGTVAEIPRQAAKPLHTYVGPSPKPPHPSTEPEAHVHHADGHSPASLMHACPFPTELPRPYRVAEGVEHTGELEQWFEASAPSTVPLVKIHYPMAMTCKIK